MAIASLNFDGDSLTQGNTNGVSLKYWIDDAVSRNDAISAMLAIAPPRLGGLIITDANADLDTGTLWSGSVTYGTKANDESSYSFQIGVSQVKTTRSLETVGAYARPGNTPTPYYGAINVTKDSIEGVDINVPTFQWNETHYLPKANMTKAFFFLLYNMTARMNAGTFRDFDRGEVLLIGVNGQTTGLTPKWEMQFTFLALPNADDGMLNDIAIGPKLGHDYLWVRYQDELNSSSHSMTKIPYEVFVERVYEFGNYDALGLPDPF